MSGYYEPEARFRDIPPHDSEPAGLQPHCAPASDRQLWELVVRAEPGVDDMRALRALLKAMLRRFGLRCINIVPKKPGP